jgi:hypothetical protein
VTGGRRGWLVAALVVAVLALAGSVAAVAAGAGRVPASPVGYAEDSGRYGPGLVGGAGPGMMGGPTPGHWQSGGRYGLAGDGQAVATMAAAKARVQMFADRLGG